MKFKLTLIVLVCVFTATALAVSSKTTSHSSGADFSKGETDNIIISNRGTIQLGRQAETLFEEGDDAWSINSIVTSGSVVYLGTSPNGAIYRISMGEITKIYPEDEPEDTGSQRNLTNEHIFAMAEDISGRLLAGISGDSCSLIRFDGNSWETVLQLENDQYIFAIEIGANGNIYLGTGPNGRIYELDSVGKNLREVFATTEKNILSLVVGDDGEVYAGTDEEGRIYRIDPKSGRAQVLYDSDQQEITALVYDSGKVYATASSAGAKESEANFAAQKPGAGRPEKIEADQPQPDAPSEQDSMQLQIPNTAGRGNSAGQNQLAGAAAQGGQTSVVYEITSEGFVTKVFEDSKVFFAMTQQGGDLLLGAGTDAMLYSVDPQQEKSRILYEDEVSSQVTSIRQENDFIYIGTANPAKLIKLRSDFAAEGTFYSGLVDAGQPAYWGTLQINAEIPAGTEINVSGRSGNVNDADHPTFSDWSDQINITGPAKLDIPVGRFSQYKLVLKSDNGKQTPVVNEVAVSSTVPNIRPVVESIEAARIPEKRGVFNVTFNATDRNDDTLIYTVDFRQVGWKNWIRLHDELETPAFEWNGRTVEDGRYELRVTASDIRSNTPLTSLTGSRISDTVIVDNTAPRIIKTSLNQDSDVVLKLRVKDELSAIADLQYTVNSNDKWIKVVPDDLVFDTLEENFTIVLQDLESGEHIIAVKASDDVKNVAYKTFRINVE